MSSNTAIVRDATERYRTARREAGESRGAFETEINTWLGANPRIKIVNVKQSSNGGGSLGSPLWLVSVWYEESAAESGAAPDTGRR